MGEEYYDRLGVSSDASTDEIAAAYREQLKETHPDVSDASDAGERTKKLIEAKEVLTDETERARYDRLGHDRYVRTEQGHTPDSDPSPDHPDQRGTQTGSTDRTADGNASTSNRTSASDGTGRSNRTSASDGTGASDATGDSNRKSASDRTTGGGPRDRRRRRSRRGTRSGRDVDWGTHTAREGRSRRTGGIDWEEWAETDWEEVSEAVWQEVTDSDAEGAEQTANGWGTASDRRGGTANSTADGWTTGTWSGASSADPTGANSTGQDSADPTGRTQGTGSTGPRGSTSNATAGHAGTAAGGGAAASSTASKSARPGGGETASDDSGDWTVGWYSGGDPSGTTHDAYSFGGKDLTGDSWSTWSPGTDHNNRYRNSSFPPHRIFSPIQTVVLFCLCFVTYPLLVTGSVFPLFSSPVRLLMAMFLVFVVAILIILSQLGVVVFGGWTLLFPIAFANFGVPILSAASLLTMSAVLLSLGLAVLSWLLIRPPAL
jgi:curved DNA-binding protein CbpA